MSKLDLTLACWDYDRTRALADGRVSPEGINLNLIPLQVEETFFRMLRNTEFDAAEMSLSSYCVSLFQDDPPFIALPFFPSRFFRHSCIFVSAKSGIARAEDLVGKRDWRAGIPDDRAGLDPGHAVRRVRRRPRERQLSHRRRGGAGPRREAEAASCPSGSSVTPIGPDQTLSQRCWPMARSTPCTRRARPRPSTPSPTGCAAAIPDYRRGGEGLFPPHRHLPDHARDRASPARLMSANPWIAQSLFKAFSSRQQIDLCRAAR